MLLQQFAKHRYQLLIQVPRRMRHQMTTLYGTCLFSSLFIETLGVTKEAKEEDIEKAYEKLKEYFGKS